MRLSVPTTRFFVASLLRRTCVKDGVGATGRSPVLPLIQTDHSSRVIPSELCERGIPKMLLLTRLIIGIPRSARNDNKPQVVQSLLKDDLRSNFGIPELPHHGAAPKRSSCWRAGPQPGWCTNASLRSSIAPVTSPSASLAKALQ